MGRRVQLDVQAKEVLMVRRNGLIEPPTTVKIREEGREAEEAGDAQ